MPYTPIVGTLGYILSPDGQEVLLVHRNAREHDEHYGKYNGLGGKLNPDEDVATGMRREIREEANIECTSMRLRGTISWPGFGANGEDWLGFIFVIDAFTGAAREANEEGTLAWHSLATLDRLPMWDGDRFFLPLLFDADPRVFHGCMPYQNGKPVNWTFERL